MKNELPPEFQPKPAYDGKSEIPEYWVNHKTAIAMSQNEAMHHEIIGPFPDTATFLPLKAHLERLGEKIPLSTIPRAGHSLRYSEMFGEWTRTNEFTPTITPSEFIRKYRGAPTGQGTWEN